MKKCLFVILSLLVALLPVNGQQAIVNDSKMFISQQVDSLTEAERYFNPIFLIVAEGKEYLKEQLICGSVCDCDTTIPNRRIGVFSVAPDKQVSFSQGNLQYFPAANLWKFADNQYDYLGNANKYLSPTFRNWVDLFGWSANNTTAPFGVSTSTNVADYAGDFVDWGNNWICGDAPGTWRTLSADEWEYLFEKREKALQLRSKGSIDGHRGHILLPDDWVLPDGVHFVAEPNNLTMDLDINSYTQAEWRIMEEAGAIFLPAAGRRDGTTVGYLVEYSGLWSSTSTANTNAYHSYYNYESEVIEHHWTSATSRMNGRSVRLVHDTIVPKVEPEYVDLGLSVKWATFNVGASKPEEYGDYFAWGETQPKEEYTWENYKWCDGTNTNMTKYNDTDGLITLLPEDDAATVNWGDKWRMPSKEEVDELTQHCNWIWTTHNNVNGYKVTGPNGNSIFLPAAGYKGAGPTYPAGEDGLYWTNTTEKQHYSYLIVLHDDAPPTHAGRQGTRCFAFTIRPVYNETPEPCLVVKVNDTLSINMVYVEGGTFTMGAMEGDTQANANEKPAHQVTLNYDYYMAQTEVTQALWKTVMGNDNNPSTIKGDNLPVNNVLWEEAQAFVEKLSQTTGQNFYLPTEAEWEYAARGGKKSKGYLYAGSNKVDEVAWYNSNSGGVTHPVAQKMPNELGIYDMSGNVWEWCSDWLAPYTAEAQLNPTGPAIGECHVYHGGGWTYGQNFCRSSNRRQTVSGYVQQALGLRVVMRKK